MNKSENIRVAWIGAGALIISALIAAIFAWISNDKNANQFSKFYAVGYFINCVK